MFNQIISHTFLVHIITFLAHLCFPNLIWLSPQIESENRKWIQYQIYGGTAIDQSILIPAIFDLIAVLRDCFISSCWLCLIWGLEVYWDYVREITKHLCSNQAWYLHTAGKIADWGAYMLHRVTSSCSSLPFTVFVFWNWFKANRMWDQSNNNFSFLFYLRREKKVSKLSFFSFSCSLLDKCVSCQKAILTFTRFSLGIKSLLLMAFFIPLTFVCML